MQIALLLRHFLIIKLPYRAGSGGEHFHNSLGQEEYPLLMVLLPKEAFLAQWRQRGRRELSRGRGGKEESAAPLVLTLGRAGSAGGDLVPLAATMIKAFCCVSTSSGC